MRGALLGIMIAMLSVGIAHAERRVALVIGNTTYENLSSLRNPDGDARRMAALLDGNGFEVMRCDGDEPGCFDLTRSDMLDALDDFEEMARGASVALVFYAGHGMQTADGNVIAPTDIDISCGDWRARREVLLDDVLEAMAGAEEKIVILDACRNDPFRAQQCLDRGARPLSFGSIAVPDSASRFLLMTSTQNGQFAQDGEAGGHSPFAEALFHWMERQPASRFDQMLDRVTKRVVERTSAANFTQIPEILIRGGAPDSCLAGGACGADSDAVALRAEVDALKAENARNQEFEAIVVAVLRGAGYSDPYALSAEERKRFFDSIMEATQALAARPDGGEVALAALRSGDVDAAEDVFLDDLEGDQGAGDPAARAASARHIAALARPSDTAKAARYYGEAVRLDPDHVQSWIELAETSLALGDRDAALEAYERADALTRTTGTPAQRMWIAEGLADMEWERGRTRVALALYREAFDLAERAIADQPDNLDLARGQIVTSYNIGHLAMDAGETDEALAFFRQGLAIAERLAAQEPGNPVWQFDIGRGHERIGRALQQAGDAAGALEHYQRKHAIMTRVAAANPTNPVWIRDLSLADEFIGDMAVAAGDHDKAVAHYQASLDRMIRLRDSDPSNADYRRFTSVTHLKAGDSRFALGETEAAIADYRAAMEQSRGLVALDPGNGQWGWDLFRAYQRMASSQPPGAEWHALALETIQNLDAAGSLSEHNRHWIRITRERFEQAQLAEAP